MSKFKDLYSKLFGKKPTPGIQVQVRDSDPATQEFKTKYWNFKYLLDHNQKILQMMSDTQQFLHSKQIFGFSFLHKAATEISVNVYKVIERLDSIAPGKYSELYQSFARIQAALQGLQKPKTCPKSAALLYPMQGLAQEHAALVGQKAATLGEIKNQLALVTPEGFALSCRAWQIFMSRDRLQMQVDQILQCLDYSDLQQVREASDRLQGLILQSPLPAELESSMHEAVYNLQSTSINQVRLAVRSSATGEDGLQTSFAGQYRSLLEVKPENLPQAYKKVLASKYTVRALFYRLHKGLAEEQVQMCVAVLLMQDVRCSGVVYSRDPGAEDQVQVSAVQGHPKLLVNGDISPDVFVFSRTDKSLLSQKINAQSKKLVHCPEQGLLSQNLSEDQARAASISAGQARELAEIALGLESHFQCAQDIEWCINSQGQIVILQSRPLQGVQTQDERKKQVFNCQDFFADQSSVFQTGVTACAGIAAGPVFVVHNQKQAEAFPEGAILVTAEALPRWSFLLSKAAGVITDHGAAAGHLATVAREYNVPALFDTKTASKDLASLEEITLDATQGLVYAGICPQGLNLQQPPGGLRMQNTPVHQALQEMLVHISPLNLLDPEHQDFSPASCRTYHDILRFCHEKAVEEMFSLGRECLPGKRTGKRLIAGVPTQWWIVDLGGGFSRHIEADKVFLQDICSTPFLAIWSGMNAYPWQGPPGVDARGFFSVMMESTMNRDLDPGGPSSFARQNCALISRNFCNLNCRFGYHYSVLQALCTAQKRENYIRFGFKGGAASQERKRLRLCLMQELMQEFGFGVQIREDALQASYEGQQVQSLQERLKVLGYIIVHTRQVDMVMKDQAKYAFYKEKMASEIKNLVLQD